MKKSTLLGVFFLLFILVIPSTGLAQKPSKLAKKGENFLFDRAYEEGVIYFESVDETIKSEDPLFSYYMGMLYYHSIAQKLDGIPHLTEYIETTDSSAMENRQHFHVYYLLAQLHHLNYEFDLAKKYYSEFGAITSNSPSILEEEKEIIQADISRKLENCNFGKIAVNNPRNVILQNLGDTVNSKFPEYAAVVSANEDRLFFTSRRPDSEGGKLYLDGLHFEDIYSAYLIKGNTTVETEFEDDSLNNQFASIVIDFAYTNFAKVGGKINTKEHEGSIQLAQKDSVMYFYRDHDIWEVKIDSLMKNQPSKLGLHVNSDQYEPSVFLSQDEQLLFIVSDREGGYGGLDIYLSRRIDNENWTEPKNLGPNINTADDEDAPFLENDGKTFYFSSKGHSSIGDYDIFRSEMQDSLFSRPVNMGHPINTPADDIFFTMTGTSKRGYYSSNTLGGKGDMDIYRITFADTRDPVSELLGFVRKGEKFTPTYADIVLTSLDSGATINTTADSVEGDYFLLLGLGKSYQMEVETDGFAPFNKEIVIPDQDEYYQLYQEVHYIYLFDKDGNTIGQKITVYNATGDLDSVLLYYDQFKFKNLNQQKYSHLSTLTNDIKFYMTQDSLRNLMLADPSLKFDYKELDNVYFLRDSHLDLLDAGSYEEITWGEFIKTLDMTTPIRTDIDSSEVTQVEGVEGLFFTVQIGVYSKEVPASVFYNLAPINSQNIPNGTIRYSTGQFYTVDEAIKRKEAIVKLGVTDAFVTAYSNGERITVEKALHMLNEQGAKILFDPNW